MRTVTVELSCPVCEAPLTATVTPGSRGHRDDPTEPAEVNSIAGCSHADDVTDDEDFIDAVLEAAAEDELRGRSDADDLAVDRMREED
jgi:hypothetical protein